MERKNLCEKAAKQFLIKVKSNAISGNKQKP